MKPAQWDKLFIFRLILATCMILPFGCEEDLETQTQNTGSVSLPISGVSPEGVTYRLVGADFTIEGPETIEISSDDYLEDVTADVDLEAGIYTIELLDGWTLERILDDGSYEPAEASLASENPVTVEIFDEEITPVVFQFTAESSPVILGD